MFEVYRSDELENAIDFLEQAAVFYKDNESNHRFKWVCISLHGALYGFAVCNVRGTNPSDRVLVESKREKKYYERDLKGIGGVLKLCQNKDMLTTEFGKVLELKENQRLSIDLLKKYRDDFSHFKPSGYSIIGSLDEVVLPVLEVIYFLAIESNNVLYSSRNQRERIIQAINTFELGIIN
ncbi:Uncharacterised protein [Niallia circulans]|uniref:hypothetical protein n=1 Tax=Niallia circulans TaxID=1397 RepID=UPI00077C938F|nr:hypothetical protein [Niallia circulans]MDR4318407.1 hypothetical protein [Niallia circulans]MED3839271.1 hypothetical protein [Niallia circulans]MED4242384.1 hypothetical protein [Niallia circulans]MED4250486.1 hypothetical protein [Niallia circulans]QKH59823.1 hypothetical protein FOC77_03690 [Niallia circulans]